MYDRNGAPIADNDYAEDKSSRMCLAKLQHGKTVVVRMMKGLQYRKDEDNKSSPNFKLTAPRLQACQAQSTSTSFQLVPIPSLAKSGAERFVVESARSFAGSNTSLHLHLSPLSQLFIFLSLNFTVPTSSLPYTMALPRPSCLRTSVQGLGRGAARRTVNQARSSPFRNAGRRTYASGHEAKQSSDLPW